MANPDWIDRPLDVLLGYEPGMPLPIVRTRHDRQWHPEDGFFARPTEDHYWMWFHNNRRGIRWHLLTHKVMRGLKSSTSLETGRRIVRRLIEQGLIDMSDVPEKDLDRAEEALAYCAGLVKDHDADHKHRLVAAKVVLEFLKAKPTVKQDVTIKSAEDFLDAIGDE